MKECGCEIEVKNNGKYINYCPLHTAAPKLLEVCKAIEFYHKFYAANNFGEPFPGNEFYQSEGMKVVQKAVDAIAMVELKPILTEHTEATAGEDPEAWTHKEGEEK